MVKRYTVHVFTVPKGIRSMDMEQENWGLGICGYHTAHNLHETGWFADRHSNQ